MSLTAVILIVISAFFHATWNMLGKKQSPTSAFFLLSSLFGILFNLPALLYFRDTLPHLPIETLPILIGTGAFMTLYYLGLAGAYRHGDMSIAYPLARSSPLLVVTVVSTLLGQGDKISAMCVAGIILVVAGTILLPMKRFRDFKLSNYWNLCSLLALLAAIGTTGYSILDDRGVHLLKADPSGAFSKTSAALVYSGIQMFALMFWMALFVLSRKTGRDEFKAVLKTGKKRAATVALFTYLAYSLVLIAMNYSQNVSYVVGFRQLSIPLGAVLGIVVLREPYYLPKALGVMIIFSGLVMIGIG